MHRCSRINVIQASDSMYLEGEHAETSPKLVKTHRNRVEIQRTGGGERAEGGLPAQWWCLCAIKRYGTPVTNKAREGVCGLEVVQIELGKVNECGCYVDLRRVLRAD